MAFQSCHRNNEEYPVIRKITVVLSHFIVTGCGFGHALQEADTGKERYRACILNQLENYRASFGVSDLTVGRTSEFVISACIKQEESYVVAMAELVMIMTGNMVSREKFLEDKEAMLRGDLRELATSLVEQEL